MQQIIASVWLKMEMRLVVRSFVPKSMPNKMICTLAPSRIKSKDAHMDRHACQKHSLHLSY